MIAKSRALNYLKQEKRIQKLQKDMYIHDRELENSIFQKEEQEDLRRQIEKLKPNQQSILYLIDIEGLSYKEASKILGKSLSNIKVLLHRSRKELSTLLRKEEEK